EGIDFDLEKRGILHIYRDRKSFEQAATVNEMLIEGGLDRHAVTPEEIKSIEPALTEKCYGGFFTPSDATGDIHKFTRGLAEACERRGARFICDASVDHIAPHDAGVSVTWSRGEGEAPAEMTDADAVVICAGVASRRFATMLGDRVNGYPGKGYSIT